VAITARRADIALLAAATARRVAEVAAATTVVEAAVPTAVAEAIPAAGTGIASRSGSARPRFFGAVAYPGKLAEAKRMVARRVE